MSNVILSYTLQQAIEDGVLVEIFKNRWEQLSGGRPIVVTSTIYSELSLSAFQEIWNEFVAWRRERNRSEDDDVFVMEMNSKDVWLSEDGQAFTIMYPEDY